MMEATKTKGSKEAEARGSVCPIYGRTYTAPPAISRTDNKTEICPVCGSREAIEAFRAAKDYINLGQETEDSLVREIEEAEIEAGRVEALP